ncbi:hypothetical protein [Ruminococcus sp.]|uniref:hypothetical protein n=1 Tax=Ruminococcus sp. TaxID=41978 RepID=UPI0025D25606|nr:hypothetical protein [Ruminococcus sp.]
MKKNISDILHSAGDKTIENIADNYTAADKKTAQRIYAKSLEKMNLSPENTETFVAERVSRSPVLHPFLIVAACMFVVGGAVFGLLKMNAPSPKPYVEEPVVVATATTVAGTETETTLADDDNSKDTGTKKVQTTSTKADITVKMAGNSKTTGAAKTNTTKANASTKRTTKSPAKTITAAKTSGTTTVNAKNMSLAEIEEWEDKHWACLMVRERAILSGEISADSPRVTLAQVKQFIAESSNFDEIYKKIRNVQLYCDINGGSGVSYIEYWVGGNRNDIVMISPEFSNISHITCTDGDIYGNTAKTEELYTEKAVTKQPTVEKPEYAGVFTIEEVLNIAKNSNYLKIEDFRKYCSYSNYYDNSHMKFKISDRDNWYLNISANYDGSIAACSIVDNVGHNSVDIRVTQYQQVLELVNDWTLTEAIMAAPTAGTITLDDVVRLHNEKGEDLAPSDFSPYLNRTFISNKSDVMKFRVINGDTYRVSKGNVVYLTLMPGYGRPLISAFLHNADMSLSTEIFNTINPNGDYKTEFDLVMALNSEKPWFVE